MSQLTEGSNDYISCKLLIYHLKHFDGRKLRTEDSISITLNDFLPRIPHDFTSHTPEPHLFYKIFLTLTSPLESVATSRLMHDRAIEQ